MAKAAYPATGGNIAHLVYGLCAIIIAVFALSNVLVLRTAGGVAWWPDDALTAKNVIRSADEALYRAKENGRGQACLASAPADEISQFQAENDRVVEATG